MKEKTLQEGSKVENTESIKISVIPEKKIHIRANNFTITNHVLHWKLFYLRNWNQNTGATSNTYLKNNVIEVINFCCMGCSLISVTTTTPTSCHPHPFSSLLSFQLPCCIDKFLSCLWLLFHLMMVKAGGGNYWICV